MFSIPIMKIFLVTICVVSFVVLALVSGKDLRIKTYFHECQSDPKTYVDEELLQKGLKGELADETPVGPHAFCMNLKRGFQVPNGDVDVVALRTYLEQAENRNDTLIDRAIKECGQRNGSTAQQAALALLDCIHRIIPHKDENH